MNEFFQRGEVVTLKSGSPEMTVTYSDSKITQCVFYNSNTHALVYTPELSTLVFELVKKS